MWAHTHRVPLQSERGQLAAQSQVLDLHQVVNIVPLQIQHLKILQHAHLAQVRHTVIGSIQLLAQGDDDRETGLEGCKT